MTHPIKRWAVPVVDARHRIQALPPLTLPPLLLNKAYADLS